MENVRLYAIILICGIVFALITYLLAKRFKEKKIIKYIPTFVSAAIGILFVIEASYFSVGMQDLAFIVLAMIAFGIFIISLITALIIEFIKR